MASGTDDLNDIEAMKRQLAELQAKLAAAEERGTAQGIATQGGAVVKGGAQAGRDFIGRDFVQIIESAVFAGEDPAEARSVISHYLEALASDLASLKLGEIDVAAQEPGREPLRLADVYVPLDTELMIPEGESLAQWLKLDVRAERVDTGRPRERRPVSVLEALAVHRELTLLGKPGGGKSTLGASVLLALCQAWLGHDDQLATLGEGWSFGALLPIRVILRRFAEWLPSGKKARAGDLWAFIGQDLDASGHGLSPDAMKYVQRIARQHGALILLDGLDECGDSDSRERVLTAVDELKRSAGERCRFLLTARPYAWPDGPEPNRGVYALSDLDEGQIERFIHGWYTALQTRGWQSPAEATGKRNDLLAARRRSDLLPLARNPLLLTLMASLHANRGRLPDDRADLYHESVDLLMLRWNRQIGADKALLDTLDLPGLKLSDLREVLEELAFKVHQDNAAMAYPGEDVEGLRRRGDAADVGEARLILAFRPLLANSLDKAAMVVDYIEKRAGLLIGQGEKDGERQFAFPHRTFQEFLAACHLAARDDFPAECQRLARAAPGHWQVVLTLAARLAKAERGASAADELIGGISVVEFCGSRLAQADDWTCALLAAMQLQEIGVGAISKGERTRAIAKRVCGWLTASLPMHPKDGGAPVLQRAFAGEVLAGLGDPRFDAQRFHLPADDMLGFVSIASDPQFRIGTRRADTGRIAEFTGANVPENEINEALTPSPAFYIARYPVTVAQFRTFVETSGFEIGGTNALRNSGSRPVALVSWHEALAYCRWLTAQLRDLSALADDPVAALVRERRYDACLPSELEWEKAARGGAQNAFPWGEVPDTERANYRDTRIEQSSAVGCFAANGYGLHDMSGNVWEWTRSLWGTDVQKPDFPYPYVADDARREVLDAGDDMQRVVRGGSWSNGARFARCACRGRLTPVDRGSGLGFRVVLRESPVP